MLKLFQIIFIFTLLPVFGQEDEAIYSIYFDAKVNPGTKKLSGIPTKHHGKFTLITQSETDLRGAAGDNLVVDETGIYLLKNRLLSISREEIRENSKYSINNDYLHGVIENDSVMAFLDGESYYFLIPRKVFLYDLLDANTSMYQGLSAKDMLVLSMEDNGHYSVIYISFDGGDVILNELDFDQKELDFRTLKCKKTKLDGTTTYILNPTTVEWQALMKNFKEYDRYRAVVKS